nr:PBP1A family penicillin-binding protein [Sphingomonas quercus]
MTSLPDYAGLKSSPNGQMIRVRAADGTVLVTLGPSYGEWLPLETIPKVMQEAIVSVEDRRFYMHPGVDPIGMGRGVWRAFQRRGQGRRIEGASTITQQITRNIFLNQSYNLGRKAREIILALAMERKFSKAEILELYLNKVYFGGGAYGIDAASRKFFGHGASSLSLGEAAIIAGLVKAPSNYAPTADQAAAVGRANVVLHTMVETGAVTQAEADAADPAAVRFAPEARQNSVRYFTDWALPQLDTLIDEKTQPIDVWTTLDIAMQRSADRAIRADAPAGAQGALVSMETDGAVRAMVGGRDYVSSIYNRATQAVRQPGSAFKLFVYLAALEAGHTPDEPVVDEPVTIDGWSPRNSNRNFAGQIDIRTAFAFSINTVAAKLGEIVGFQTVADMAKRFGITSPINTHPSMVLGTSEVRLIEMTRAFAEVAANGVAVTPYGITRVTVVNGGTLYEHELPEPRVLVAPWVAAQATDLLQTAVNTGTARAAQIGRPVAGKTGTTSSNKDGWFLGFSSGLTTGVWMGRDDARPMPGLSGGRAPAQAFADFMKEAVAKRPVQKFATEVKLPEWQLEPDEEAYFGAPDENGVMVDENGQPLPREGDQPDEPPLINPGEPPAPGGPPLVQPAPAQGEEAPPRLDQQWLDGVLGRQQPQPQPRRNPASLPGGAPPPAPRSAVSVQPARPTQ